MTITPDSCFEISSGAVCFGSRREIGNGSKLDIQAPSCPTFECGGGTVFSHDFRYNFKALDGKWNVYHLVTSSGARMAAFCSHESLNAYAEAKRIVDVANAPWERDNGTDRNTRETFEGRVVVVNRYDWMEDYYAEEEDGILLGEEDLIGGGQRNSRWLVDYRNVQSNDNDYNQWCTSGKGVRLVIFGEYVYGRFGLIEDRSAVQSFLFFTGDTALAKTTFRADERPVYIPLTEEQRHAKCLEDGAYTGFHWLRSPACRTEFPDGDIIGPFGVDTLISLETMETLLRSVQPTVPMFEPQLQGDMVTLLNESLAVWVYCLGRLADDADTRDEFIKEAFPNSFDSNKNNLHSMELVAMEGDDGLEMSAEVVHRIVAPTSKLWNYLSIREVSCGLKCLLKEILELAGNCARDSYRRVLVPYDVRLAINNDRELCDECINCSKVFWPPDMVNGSESANDDTN